MISSCFWYSQNFPKIVQIFFLSRRIPGQYQEFGKCSCVKYKCQVGRKFGKERCVRLVCTELRDLLSHLGHVSFPSQWVSWVVGWLLWSITYMDGTRHFSKLLQSKIWRTKGNGNKTWHKHFLLLTRPHP